MATSLSLSSHYDDNEDESVTHGMSDVLSGEEFQELYEIGDVIGRGSFSIVRVAKQKSTGNLFACKIIDKFAVFKKNRLRDEIKILMSVRHKNIISLHAIFETKRELLLVIDLAEGGELFDRIVQKEKYSESEAGLVVTSLLEAILFLHSQNIIHRDLKPENILLDLKTSDTHIKISDFGLAKIFDSENTNSNAMDEDDNDNGRMRAYTSCGTDYYVAPEVLRGDGYGPQVDMWSIGVITYILLSGFPPFYDDYGDMTNVYEKIRSGTFDFPSPYWDAVSEEAKNLIRGLLTVDPEKRFTAQQALDHPWIRARSTLKTGTISPHFHEMFARFNAKRKISGSS